MGADDGAGAGITPLPPRHFMTPRTLIAYLGMIRRLGLRQTMAVLRHRSSERYHERRLGVETAQMVEMKQLGITNPGHAEYAPTPFRDFSAIFDRLPIRAGHDVLIDYGSGKGRALILAASYPFRRIIGVEFSEALNAIAARHLEAARRHFQCTDVQAVSADATSYIVPDDVTIAYFNNPFDRPLFEKVLARLRASLAAHPRPFRIVLNYPPDSQLLDAITKSGWLTIVDDIGLEADRRCAIARAAVVPDRSSPS
jgi:hypothetical protein